MKDDKKDGANTKKKRGRPTKFTDDVKSEICDRIASGQSLISICKDDHIPDKVNVLRCLLRDENFRTQYTHARSIQADVIFEMTRQVAENTEIGTTRKSKYVDGVELESEESHGDMIAHRRLKIDTYKWMLGKMSPKKYGEHIEVAHSGNIDTTMRIVTKDDVDEDDIGFVES